MQPKVIIAIVLICVLAVCMTTFSVQFLTKQKKLSEHEKFVKYNKHFHFFYDFVLTRKMFRKVYAQVNALAVYNFMEARVQAVKFYERSLLMSATVFVIALIGFGDIVTGILLLVFCSIYINNSVSKKIDDVNYQCYRAISYWCGSLSDNFTRLRNVPDAINQSSYPKILEKMVNKIYLITTANDGRQRLDDFFAENQNRQLRTIAVTCYLRNDIGEDPTKGSPFKSALRLIKDEVDAEVRRQLNMRLMFKSLEYLPFIPLFCYPVIKWILQKIVPATAGTFASTIGYAAKIIMLLVAVICYYILSTINNASVARTDDRLDFITKLLYRTKVREFARTLIPKSFKKRNKTQKTIDGCLSSKTLEYIALEKFVFGCVGIVAAIILSIAIIIGARSGIYNSLTSSSMTSTLTYTAEQEAAVLEYQHAIMDGDINPSMDEIEKFYISIYPKITEIELKAHTDRLTSVISQYRSTHFRWLYCIIYIGAWFAGHFLSDFLLMLRAKLVESEAEVDVLQLQTIIAILMDTPLDTLSVIYWLAKSSDIHKDVLTYCYHEYTRDAYYALDHLKRKSAIPEFSAICDKLKTTIEQVTLGEAFEDLILDRANTMAIRETVQMSSLKHKRAMASPIAIAPMVVWMIVGFILPVVIVALNTATTTLSSINNLGG